MRILMVNKYLYPRAGAETYMLGLSTLLQSHGHEVAFFGMDHQDNTTLGPCYTVPFVELGIGASALQKGAALAHLCGDALSGRVHHALDKAIASFKPDLIHAHNVYNQLSPSLFDKVSAKIPVVMTVHDYKPVCPSYNLFTEGKPCTRCLGGAYRNCIEHRCVQDSLLKSTLAASSSYYHRWRNTYSRYNAFIAPSAFLKGMLVKGGLPDNKIEVIYNFMHTPSVEGVMGSYLFYAGRLCKEKGVDTLLEAYHALGSQKPPLLIAGTGPLAEKLRGDAAAQGETQVEWLGQRPPLEVQSLMATARCVIVPSLWYENCSMSILEAMACGKPLIASDSGGNPELIRDGDEGLLFKAGDVSALTHSISRLLADESLCSAMGDKGKERIEKQFSPEGHLQKIESLYQKLTDTESTMTILEKHSIPLEHKGSYGK